jgi:hypothetical protein
MTRTRPTICIAGRLNNGNSRRHGRTRNRRRFEKETAYLSDGGTDCSFGFDLLDNEMKFIKNIWNIWWNQWTLYPKLISIGVILAILLVLWLVFFREGGSMVKIDENSIQKVNSPNERERKKELQAIIEDNQDIIKTTDERTEIVNINVVEKNREIDDKVKAADARIQEVKQQKGDVTSEELEKILLGSEH